MSDLWWLTPAGSRQLAQENAELDRQWEVEMAARAAAERQEHESPRASAEDVSFLGQHIQALEQRILALEALLNKESPDAR